MSTTELPLHATQLLAELLFSSPSPAAQSNSARPRALILGFPHSVECAFVPVPGVSFAACFFAGSFFFLFLLSTVCYSMAAACPPLIAGVFGTPSSTPLVVSSGTISFSPLLSMFWRRFSICRNSECPSSSILRSIASRRAVSLLFSAVERGASSFRSASFSAANAAMRPSIFRKAPAARFILLTISVAPAAMDLAASFCILPWSPQKLDGSVPLLCRA